MRVMTAAECLLAIALGGCITPQVTEKPAANVDFHQFKTVRYTVHPLPTTEYGSDESDKVYARETISLTESLLGKKLESIGYTLVGGDGTAELALDVAVTACKPGNGAARFWLGFGAGRAIYAFEASFANQDGKSLGKFQGGRLYTGMEFGQALLSRDEISTLAAIRAVQQIQEFMANGGSFPDKNQKK